MTAGKSLTARLNKNHEEEGQCFYDVAKKNK